MKIYKIWSTRRIVMDDSNKITFEGKIKANSFQEACDIMFKNKDGYNLNLLTIWGCGLYDNEQDARRNFG